MCYYFYLNLFINILLVYIFVDFSTDANAILCTQFFFCCMYEEECVSVASLFMYVFLQHFCAYFRRI
jgi:hypothetical protein